MSARRRFLRWLAGKTEEKGSDGKSKEDLSKTTGDTSAIEASAENDRELISNVDRVAPFLESSQRE